MYLYVFIRCLPPALDGGGGFAYNDKRNIGAGQEAEPSLLQAYQKPHKRSQRGRAYKPYSIKPAQP